MSTMFVAATTSLVVEFHGQLASTAFEDNNKPLPQLVPDATSELICNSKIFALVSGTENGIKKQLNLKEQTYILARNPASFPFRILLPENHDQLPSSLKSSNLSVEYFLVCYLRTEHGYEELDKRPLHFRGHNLITFQNECKTFKVVLPMELAGDSLEHLEEIFIGTGRLLTASETNKGPGLFSRIRSQSVSSLLSLFPPSYSGLPSRRGSQISLETCQFKCCLLIMTTYLIQMRLCLLIKSDNLLYSIRFPYYYVNFNLTT
ncbi:hypothetical protein Fcan01_00856 [Folsomia candida]|uniref:Uncharacterized protein n=1 Tax=Folsomia candida TaxID=158441 RepID=A0A226F1I7_FOLCA|nr:hypothetical protein Fcan01_00856 [Folsomia candida]